MAGILGKKDKDKEKDDIAEGKKRGWFEKMEGKMDKLSDKVTHNITDLSRSVGEGLSSGMKKITDMAVEEVPPTQPARAGHTPVQTPLKAEGPILFDPAKAKVNTSKIEALETQLAASKIEAKAVVEKYEKTIASLEESNSRLEKQIDDLRTAALFTPVSDGNSDQILAQQVQSLQEANTRQREELLQARALVDASTSREQKEKARAALIERELDQLRRQVETLSNGIAEISAQRQNVAGEADNWHKKALENAKYKAEVEELERKLNSERVRHEKAEHEFEERLKNERSKSSERGEEEMKKLEQNCIALKEKLDHEVKGHRNDKLLLEDLRKHIADRDTDIERLHDEIAKAKIRETELKGAADDLKKDIDAAQKQALERYIRDSIVYGSVVKKFDKHISVKVEDQLRAEVKELKEQISSLREDSERLAREKLEATAKADSLLATHSKEKEDLVNEFKIQSRKSAQLIKELQSQVQQFDKKITKIQSRDSLEAPPASPRPLSISSRMSSTEDVSKPTSPLAEVSAAELQREVNDLIDAKAELTQKNWSFEQQLQSLQLDYKRLKMEADHKSEIITAYVSKVGLLPGMKPQSAGSSPSSQSDEKQKNKLKLFGDKLGSKLPASLKPNASNKKLHDMQHVVEETIHHSLELEVEVNRLRAQVAEYEGKSGDSESPGRPVIMKTPR